MSESSRRYAVLALAMGGFAIGTTEFVTMGLLREIAAGVDASIPSAGHLISAYAAGVVVGAPLLAFLGARMPRKRLLLALMAAFVVGNAATALAVGYDAVFWARFAAGLPHGAYFGVASLVAAELAAPGRAGRAVSQVMLGLATANVLGVPAATWLGQHLGWRSAYWAVTVMGLITIALVLWSVPARPAPPEAGMRRELTAFARPQVWLTLLIGAVGFGGMFAFYSYISPLVTETGGLGDGAVPVALLVFGLGMTLGTWLGGVVADRSVFGSMIVGGIGMTVVLALVALLSPYGWWAMPVFGLTSVVGSVLVVNLQLRLMDVAGEAKTLGAALNHASLNLANALGAWLGGLVLIAGFDYPATAWVGVGLSILGLIVIALSGLLQRRDDRTASAADDEVVATAVGAVRQ
ncbi:MFS transporter [Alteromonas gracilis]